MQKRIKLLIPLLVLVAVAAIAFFAYSAFRNTDTTTSSNASSTGGSTSSNGLTVYTNDYYRFSLSYPVSYKTNSIYSIWGDTETSSRGIGINKYQETIFSISAYKKASDSEEIAKLKSESTEEAALANGIKARVHRQPQGNYIDGLFIETNNFAYSIYSTYADRASASPDVQNHPEWQEYQDLVNSLKIADPQ